MSEKETFMPGDNDDPMAWAMQQQQRAASALAEANLVMIEGWLDSLANSAHAAAVMAQAMRRQAEAQEAAMPLPFALDRNEADDFTQAAEKSMECVMRSSQEALHRLAESMTQT
jgi:hypothetical protein